MAVRVQLLSATKVLKRTLWRGEGRRRRRESWGEYTRMEASTTLVDVPKGHFTVYVGTTACKTRMVLPMSYLNHPLFKDMLARVEEEFGYHHPMGGITVPYTHDHFLSFISLI